MTLGVKRKRLFGAILMWGLSLALCLGFSRVASALDEAKIHVAGTPNITSFVYHLGKEKGFAAALPSTKGLLVCFSCLILDNL
jgi:ABC-type nitrate/sulfonate/bicarbonate transport system substrate-binding protein